MRAKILITLLLAIALFFSYQVFIWRSEVGMIVHSNLVAKKVESFKAQQGRLPKNLGEINESEKEWGPFYNIYPDSSYCLSFFKAWNDGGTNVSFCSKDKRWEFCGHWLFGAGYCVSP